MEKEKEENRKRSKITRVLAIVVIILLLLALTVCLIIIFTHRHAMTYYSAAEATCTTDGNAEYWYCAGCNSYFEDENGNNKIERDDVLVSAKGHSWVGESCEAPRHCSVCNYVDGEPLGHDFSEYIFDGNAACTSDGTETATCTRCDATHTQISYGSAIGHDYVESVVAATCTSSGSVSLICSVCGDSEVATIPATGHSWISATCTSARECATCGAVSGSALGHSWGDWTSAGDSRHSRECSRCHNVEYSAHDFGGAEYGTCTVCGYTKEQPSKGGTEITMGYDNVTQVFNGSMDMNYDVSGISFSPGGSWNSDFSLNFTAESDMNMSVNISEDWADYYVSAYNTAGVTLEYHPIKFSLFIDNGTGFEAVSDCSDLGMGEFLDALSKNTTLNRTVSAGEYVDLTFRIRASWALEVIEPDYFEVIGSDGISYKFADDSGYNIDTWYISHLDTALGELSSGKTDFSWEDTYDMDGNRWLINYADSYNLTLEYNINIAITQN